MVNQFRHALQQNLFHKGKEAHMKSRTFVSKLFRLLLSVTILAVVCSIQIGFAQDGSWLKNKTANARLNLSVPDAPAFKILDDNPSTIMRPTSVREIALAVKDFARSGGVLPKTFAAEFSPAMFLFGRSLSLEQYRANPFLYRMRVSAATRRIDENSGTTQASVGLRLTFEDDADPRTDTMFLTKLSGLAKQINELARGVQERAPTESVKRVEVHADQLEKQLDDLRSQQKDSLWNARVIELGTAVRFFSNDSLAHNVRADKYAGWFVDAFPVNTWGQLVFGANGTVERSSSGAIDSTSISISGRLYIGTNNLKFFSEAQWQQSKGSEAQGLLNVGGELNAVSSFWLEFNVGLLKRGTDASTIVTSFNLRWSLPEELVPW